jgi:hypothetical protein
MLICIEEGFNRFKPVGGPIRRPSATNGGSTLRGDEESACARKLDNSQKRWKPVYGWRLYLAFGG